MIGINVHASNINGKGLGSTLIFKSLLPYLIKKIDTSRSYFFCSKQIEDDIKEDIHDIPHVFHNSFLPNMIYRFFECTFWIPKFNNSLPLLTFGDIPLRFKGKQILFLQNSLIVSKGNSIKDLKLYIMKIIFKMNLKFVYKIIVQTDTMKKSLANNYLVDPKKILIINQPPANEYLRNIEKGVIDKTHKKEKIKLFYPASCYAHKNHQLISKLEKDHFKNIESLYLTIPKVKNPNPKIKSIKCIDVIDHNRVASIYDEVDALLFLSTEESYGLPLIEAMCFNLHIICPNLSYAKEICGEEAIYFEHNDAYSLIESINILLKKISKGRRPNWSSQLNKIERSWDMVATNFIDAFK